MSELNKRLVRRALDEVFAQGSLDTVDEIFHPDFVNHEAGPRTPPGPGGLKMTVAWLHSSFSDLLYDIKDEIVEGDKVVVRVISSGRHTGEFIGFPPTGKTFAVEQIHIYRIADGKLIEHWSSRDDLSQGMQLGFIPAGARPSPAAPAPPGSTIAKISRRPTETAGKLLAKAAEVPVGGGTILSPDHVVITQPERGLFRAFSSTCTHLGCTVTQVSDGVIKCPCHGSEFSAADGSVQHGPAARPLMQYELTVKDGGIEVSAW